MIILPGWKMLVKFQAMSMLFAYIAGPIAYSALYQTKLKSMYRKLIYPSIVTFVCSLLIYWSGYDTIVAIDISLIVLSIFYYVFSKILNYEVESIKRGSWVFIYLLGLTIIGYYGNYAGGQNILTEGVDVMLVALLSFISILIVQKCQYSNERIKENIHQIMSKYG